MKDIACREKHYVQVIASFDADGRITPLRIVWDDGRHFDIDRVLDRRRAASLKTGGTGIRYTVRVHGRTTYLFFEDPRWFVEAIVATMPE